MNAEDEYLDSLRAMVIIALPLTKVPDKVPITIGLRGDLLTLEVALLRVQTEVITQQLMNQHRRTTP